MGVGWNKTGRQVGKGEKRGAETEKREGLQAQGDRFSCDLTYILGLHIRCDVQKELARNENKNY